MGFSKNFIWGASTASYQIEGAWNEDGKGLSTWDMFTSRPNAIFKNHNGKEACDHYHRYLEDIEIMKKIGLKGYRFSFSWPRIIPEGVGEVNEKGLDFYDRLVDALLEADICPYPTIYHWDYPLNLYKKGGWLNSDSSNWFAEYTRVLADRFTDRIEHWMTINEPQVFTWAGHKEGRHAPGLKLDTESLVCVAHNVLLSHGKAVQTLRSRTKRNLKIGMAPEGIVKIPATNSPQDIEAARQATFSMDSDYLRINTWWMDPVFLGHYPTDGLELLKEKGPVINDGDMEIINQPLDFFGFNNYFSEVVQHGKEGNIQIISQPPGSPRTAYQWDITPSALYWGTKFFYERYGKPIIITENGLSNLDWVSVDGQVHDPQRIDFLTRYLVELEKIIEEGIPVLGYFQWTLMDNFEWGAGYRERFGLVHVDYETQKRTLKDSAKWYARVISENGANLTKNLN
ncbi:GH1 family beta-glucosidase [Pleomorphochaeta sp. DL1XJH-081]|uniref:GH1 family beta-glucosidase n=1 Tax=Pleomorphochaeta sp. DL1XJH-081 TaxID=3409690 RepID=UPI003BB5030E